MKPHQQPVVSKKKKKSRNDSVQSTQEPTGESGINPSLLTTIEGTGEGLEVPVPYPQTCLQFKNSEKQECFFNLAKQVFHKLSKKKSARWIPTTIQRTSWSVLNRDLNLNLIAIATTGSGKTLSYAIPMVDSCMQMATTQSSSNRVHGLILVPTRELAIQVSKVFKVVSKCGNKLLSEVNHQKTMNIDTLGIYGGVDKQEQINYLLNHSSEKATHLILAATPMRIIDLIGIGEGRKISKGIESLFETTKYFVVDEADRMAVQADLSDQVQSIFTFLKANSHSLNRHCLFSATLPERSMTKCNEWVPTPRVTIKVGTVTVTSGQKRSYKESFLNSEVQQECKTGEGSERKEMLDFSTIPSHIQQILHVCATHKKPKKLCHTIKKIRDGEKTEKDRRRKGLMIIFFARIKTLQYIHQLLLKEGVQCVPIHSKMSQKSRENGLNCFRSGKNPILLTTDICARGLHCNNVEYVVNYDFPGSLDQVSYELS